MLLDAHAASLVAAASFTKVAEFSGLTFFDNFSFMTAKDPTPNTTNQYISRANATKANLIYFNQGAGSAFMAVDSSTVVPSGGKRSSVRIQSNKVYNSGTLLVADIGHAPTGCGTWPAMWFKGLNQGELDFMEGVNTMSYNNMVIHTSSGCYGEPDRSSQLGQALSQTCGINDPPVPSPALSNGCATKVNDSSTFGPQFNAVGGGAYTINWDTNGFAIHFFSRPNIPADILSENPNPDTWGLPLMRFDFGCCPSNHFQDLRLIINTALCGKWPISNWGDSGCPSDLTCEQYVLSTPGGFNDAYWAIHSIKEYKNNGK
ncbi:putative endo-1,3(4)-beta-glucanase [Polychytrium aggregatum]|uniref:putative endo-1,3(4)-beta-glucanase n=1 Tax=Polychytrium aggregatum TaxID=110093 RepID=UPI0022FE3FEB|nr:putative endo-1,3(4)-beta-glucanase [Polychytrium aggregatum]KAI9203752.1 putative endo-1,3(4)-beta-glucanase [Polychytrium aggregatum]